MKPLSALKQGERAYIVDLVDNEVCFDFFEKGIFPGEYIEVEEIVKGSNRIIIKYKNKSYEVNNEDAESVITNRFSFYFSLN